MLQPMVKSGGRALKFRTLNDYDETYEAIAGPFTTDELTYWFVLEIMDVTGYNMPGGKYSATLYVVSPDWCQPHQLRIAAESSGCLDYSEDTVTPLHAVDMLKSYGVSAPVVSTSGNNKAKLRRELAVEASACTSLFGFYLDRQMNAFGDSGWTFLEGCVGPQRAEDVKRNEQSCADLIAAFALAGRWRAPADPYEDEETLETAARAYVRHWLLKPH